MPEGLRVRIISLALRAFPASFRAAVGADLMDVYFDWERDSALGGGRAIRLWFWLRAVLEIIREGALERLAIRHSPGHRRRDHGTRMSSMLQDVRYAARSLARTPTFTAVAILTLALGIGSSTAIFSVVDGVLFRPLPYPDSEDLVRVGGTWPNGSLSAVSGPMFLELREMTASFAAIGATVTASLDLAGDGVPERFRAAAVSAGFFRILGVPPALGRGILPGEDHPASSRVLVLSHGLWQGRWGGDPGVVGRTLTLNGEQFTVVGVMPPGFQPPEALGHGEVEMWFPLAFANWDLTSRNNWFLHLVARLEPGTTLEAARQQVNGYFAGLTDADPGLRRHGGQVQSMFDETVGDIGTRLVLLLGAVGFLLLIACANVANLFLARATDRAREVALRTALGAGKARIVRQFLTESLLLAAGGGALGIVIAFVGVEAFVLFSPGDIPRIGEVAVNHRALGVTAALSVATGMLFGLAPVLGQNQRSAHDCLRENTYLASAGHRRSAVRNTLVVVEAGLALMLLVGAGLLLNSFVRLQRVDPGFSPINTLAFRIDLRPEYDTRDERTQFFRALLDRVSSVPGVSSAGASTGLPFARSGSIGTIVVEGQPTEENQRTAWQLVSPGYFETLAAEIQPGGRSFASTDDAAGPRVAIVNDAFARQHWSERNAVGRRLKVIRTGENHPWFTVIGVANDFKQNRLGAPTQPEIFVPLAQGAVVFPRMDVIVKSRIAATGLVAALRNAVWSIDPNQPVGAMITMEDYIARSVIAPRFYTMLLTTFATIAMVLAAIGIYGTMTYAVGQRNRELGIRMALGARSGDVRRLVVRQGMKLTLAGLLLGLGGSILLSRALANFMFGVTTTDAPTFAAATAVLAAAGLAACYIPAVRATRIDPLTALRSE